MASKGMKENAVYIMLDLEYTGEEERVRLSLE
jgi:hypothetical protein